MRIISGTLGGRRIQPPAQMPHTRPTTDMAKEGLFNMLQHNVDLSEIVSLDLFGGTGCISYELASRGAKELTIVEKDAKMYEFIKKTAAELKISNLSLVREEVFSYINHCQKKFNFIFAGPPYALTTIDDLPIRIFNQGLLEKGGWFVLEHTPRNNYKKFDHYRTERNYGTTIFSIFIQD